MFPAVLHMIGSRGMGFDPTWVIFFLLVKEAGFVRVKQPNQQENKLRKENGDCEPFHASSFSPTESRNSLSWKDH